MNTFKPAYHEKNVFLSQYPVGSKYYLRATDQTGMGNDKNAQP